MRRGRSDGVRSHWPVLFGLALGSVLMAMTAIAQAGLAHAQPSRPGAPIPFDIPAQPLDTALDAYGSVSRMQILYETALTAGRRSTVVKGLYTEEAALRLLLAGTGIEVAYTQERAFTLVRSRLPDPARRATRAGHVAIYDRFLGDLQTRMLAALCAHPDTRPGAFRLAVQFRITGAGTVEDLLLLSSTGIVARDGAITGLLTGLALAERPPPGMPQPVTMVLAAGPSDGADACRERRR